MPFDFLKKKRFDFGKLPHFEEPRNDNERLLEFQYQYKVNGDKAALEALYKKGIEICLKVISQKSKENKFIKKLSSYERQEKAIDATNSIVIRLLKNPEWYIEKGFVSYLYLRVLHELFYKRKVDEIVTFVDFDLRGAEYDSR